MPAHEGPAQHYLTDHGAITMSIDRQTAEFILGYPVDDELWQAIEFLDGEAQDNEYYEANGLPESANYDYGEELNDLAERLGYRNSGRTP